MVSTNLENTFTTIESHAIKVVKEVVSGGFFNDGVHKDARMEMLTKLVRRLSDTYHIDTPKLCLDKNAADNKYVPSSHTIVLKKPDMIDFLVGFRIYMISQGLSVYKKDINKDINGWACSMFFRVEPNVYARAVIRGKIPAVDAVFF